MTSFWGLYDGFTSKQAKAAAEKEATSSSVSTTTSDDSTKKRTAADAGLVPRTVAKKPAPSITPRVARMAQKGIKEEQPVKTEKPTTEKPASTEKITTQTTSTITDGMEVCVFFFFLSARLWTCLQRQLMKQKNFMTLQNRTIIKP